MLSFKIIFLFFTSLLLGANLNSNNQNFQIIDNNLDNSKLLFTLSDFEVPKNQDKHEFKANNKLGVTMDKGHPQLPVYSTLFKINPDKNLIDLDTNRIWDDDLQILMNIMNGLSPQ